MNESRLRGVSRTVKDRFEPLFPGDEDTFLVLVAFLKNLASSDKSDRHLVAIRNRSITTVGGPGSKLTKSDRKSKQMVIRESQLSNA